MGTIRTEWSDSDMEKFENEIRDYRVEVVGKNNETFKYLSNGGQFKYLEDQGIIKVKWSKDWKECFTISDFNFGILKSKHRIYEEFQNKINFYNDWKKNKQAGKFGLE